MLIETLCRDFTKARSVNQTSAAFVSKVPTGTEPAGDAATATGASVFDLYQGGMFVQNSMLIVPYGTDTANQTFNLRVIGWKVIGRSNASTLLWIPVTLVEVQCILGTTTGVAGRQVLNTELFVDTISIVTGNANVSVDINSPADNTIGHLVVGMKGFQKAELSFQTGASAVDCNALVTLL